MDMNFFLIQVILVDSGWVIPLGMSK